MAERGTVTARIVRLVTEDLDEEALARRVCEACVADLDIDGAAISVLPERSSRRTLWATDQVAVALEELQFTLNEGACIEAVTSGVPVSVADLSRTVHRARWPVFAAEVEARTLARALYALPLHWGAVTIGVLDLYRLRAGEFAAHEWLDLLGVAEVTALLLLGRRTRPGTPTVRPDTAAPTTAANHGIRVEGDGLANPGFGKDDNDVVNGTDSADAGLDDGVFGRPEIHQAVGMVLVQLGIGAEEALARMRAWAFTEQRMLVDVARDVVDRRLVFTEEMR